MLSSGQVHGLNEAVSSVLRQPECLELVLVINGDPSVDVEWLLALTAGEPRLRIIDINYAAQVGTSSAVFGSLRGSFICILSDYDVCLSGSLGRAVHSLSAHPDWLMVCGDREETDPATCLTQRRLAFPGPIGLQASSLNDQISRPAAVFRRSMALLLGFINGSRCQLLDPEFFHLAFADFSQRIGYVPHLQLRTCFHHSYLDDKTRRRLALEATARMAHRFGAAPATSLHNYALELQLGIAPLPEGVGVKEHLSDLVDQAVPWLEPEALRQFRHTWHLDLATAPAQLVAEHQAAALQLPRLLSVRLLQAAHPELLLDAPGPPSGPHLRLQQAVHHFRNAYPLLDGSSAPAEVVPFAERPFGVNLIGHAYEVFGLGEDIRMAASALMAADVPCCVIYQPAANGSACTDHSLEPLVCADSSGGPYAFNLVCMAAPSHARWLLKAGFDPLRERFTLTAWPWETQQWPKAWFPLLEVSDELWPSSAFTAAALQAPAVAAAIPLHVLPMAASVPEPDRFCNPAARCAARAKYDLPVDCVLFAYSFDLNSSAIRKNPMGSLEAFQRAFPLPELPASCGREINIHPLSNQVALMIKAFPPQVHSPEWHWLQLRAAEDPRIHLVVANLERDDLLALYGCCDVFLSLHRSEGFGRGMAEALQLGLDVISTAYGGNCDFCTGPLVHPVRFQIVPIPRGTYPCADGHHWAEPDLGHAAVLMQEVAARRRTLDSDPATASFDPSRHADVLAAYRQRFSYATAGFRYRARLEELWAKRHVLAPQLKWKADTPV